jgi:hypothetical protein
MKTNESQGRGSLLWRTGALGLSAALWLSLLAGACGGSVSKGPSVGSESHFLAYCSGSCAAGLDCIGGICTRSCLTEQTSCGDLATGASCTNQSVEPGRVAVCDVSCGGPADCSALGSRYGCEAGFCRASGSAPGGSGGSGGSRPTGSSGSGGSASGACNPVGRYEVGKEGGYLPCCPGLTELSILVEMEDASRRRVCEQVEANSYSCIEGSCGDGICSEGEAPCGCGVDCPDSNWRASEAFCEQFRDQSPPPDVRTISIVNTGTVPLHIQREGCERERAPMIRVLRDGQRVDVAPEPNLGPGCRASCQAVLDSGWPYGTDRTGPCFSDDCVVAGPAKILPGQTLQEPVYLEASPQQLPRYCAEGIASETVECFTRVIPQPGNYTLELTASLIDCGSAADCECEPDGAGGCRNGVTLVQPFVISQPSSWYYQNQTLEISAPN